MTSEHGLFRCCLLLANRPSIAEAWESPVVSDPPMMAGKNERKGECTEAVRGLPHVRMRSDRHRYLSRLTPSPEELPRCRLPNAVAPQGKRRVSSGKWALPEEVALHSHARQSGDQWKDHRVRFSTAAFLRANADPRRLHF